MARIEVRIEDIPPQYDDSPGIMRVNPHFYLKYGTLWFDELSNQPGLEKLKIETDFDVPFGEAWVVLKERLYKFDIPGGSLIDEETG